MGGAVPGAGQARGITGGDRGPTCAIAAGMKNIILCAMLLSACGAADEVDSASEDLLGGPGFPQPHPTLSAISPSTGTPGTAVRITGSGLGQLACTGGREISLYFLVYGDSFSGTGVACTYNADGSITATVPAGTTTSAPFQLKQYQNPCGPYLTCNQLVTVSSSPTFTLSPGTLAIQNQSQATVEAWALDGVAQSGTVAPGTTGRFTEGLGGHSVAAALDVLTPGGWVEVCGESGNVTIASGQTSTFRIAPLTAGQWLNHCVGSVDYAGSDAAGHFIVIRLFANDAWQEFDGGGNLLGSGTLSQDSISPPFVSFNIGGSSVSGFGWPYDSFFLTIGANQFLLERDARNPW